MRSNSANDPFDLEILEPRILLSAEPSLLAPVAAVSHAEFTDSATAVTEEGIPQQVNSAIAYDCTAQVNDIFEGVASSQPVTQPQAPGDAVGNHPTTAAAPAPAEPAENQGEVQAAESPLPATPVSPAADQGPAQVQTPAVDVANPFPDQLTQTLRAANGPPDSTSSTVNGQSAVPTSTSGSGHYTGVRLNGVPFGQVMGPLPEVLQINTGDTLSGTGTIGAPIVVSGTISPGNSPGLLQTGSQTWLGASFPYDWEINSVSGGEGTNPGWDFQRITGGLTITATNATPAIIRVKSLQLSNAPGNVSNFNSASSYTWRILSTTTGINGFSQDAVKLNTTGFTNSLGTGTFVLDVSADGLDLLVRFVPVLPNLSFAQPSWIPQGPDYITGNENSILLPDDPASGAVQSIAVHPTNPAIAWLGAVNGGLWVTTNLNWSRTNGINDDSLGGIDDPAETPTWTPIAQDLPSLAVAALAVSPFDRFGVPVTNLTPLNQMVLFVGTGSFSSSADGGEAAGLFRSLDGGASWTEIGNFDGLRTTAIVPSTQTPGLVFVGTYELPFAVPLPTRGGVLRSTDNGNTWTRLSGQGGLPEFHVTDLVQEPGNPGRFYVALAGKADGLNASDIGVYRTDNGQSGAVTWIKVVNGILPDYDHDGIPGELQINEDLNNNAVFDPGEDLDKDGVLDLGEDANNNGVLDDGELDLNGDGVLNTVNAPEDLDLAVRIRLSVSNAVGHAVYAAVIGELDSRLAGVFRSANAGGVWNRLGSEPRTNGGQGWLHFGIAADPTDNNTVYIAGDASTETPYDGVVYRWDTGPGQWTRISAKSRPDSSGPYGATAPHADIRMLAFDVGNNGFMAMTDGGIYRLQNPRIGGGLNWEFIARGVSVAELSSVAYDRATDTIIAGLQDNGVLAQRPGMSDWYGLLGGDGNFVGVAYINPLAPVLSTRFYMGNNFLSFKRQDFLVGDIPFGTIPILLKDVNDLTAFSGLNDRWRRDGATDQEFRGFQPIPFALNAVDDLSDGKMKVLIGRIGLYTSDDNGDHLVSVPGWDYENQRGYVTALAYGGRSAGVNNQNIIYAALGNGQILVSSDNGGKFQQVLPKGAGEIFQISPDPENWHTAFAVDQNHVWAVTVDPNGVPTAVDVTGNLGQLTGGFRSVEAINISGQLVVLVGARDGVYRLRVGDATTLSANPETYASWSRFGVGLPNVQVSDLQFDPVDNVLIAGTRGRGAWKISNAATAILSEPVLRFDADYGNQQVRLVLSTATAATPRGLEFYLGGSLIATYPLSNISKISVRLGNGTDSLIVDSTEGAVSIPGGIEFDGGLGVDTLDFQGPATSVMENTVQGAFQIRQSGTEKVRATNVETFLDSTTQQTLLNATRNGFQYISDWFFHLNDLGNIPLLGDALGSALNGNHFRPRVGLEDEAKGAEGEAFGDIGGQFRSFLTRLLEEGPGGFRISDIGTLITNAVNLQSLLDSLDNIPGNVTVDNGLQKIVLGDPTDPNKPLKRTITFQAPLDATLLGGLIKLHGNLELSAEIDLMMEMGVDARGFYLRTNATAQPEITIRNIVVNGELSASGTFGIVAVDLQDATLTLDPDVSITIDLLEPADPYGHPADGKLRLYEFTSNLAGLFNIAITGDPLQDDLRLDGQFTLSAATEGPFLNLGTINLALIWEDINDLGSLRVDASASPAADMLMRFLNMDKEQLLGQFQQFMDALNQLGNSSLLDVDLPFGNGFQLRDVFDFSQSFLNRIYAKLVDVDLTGATHPNAGNITQGKLNADAKFNLIVDGVTSTLITVTQISTNNNSTLSDLADDINAALPLPVAAKVRAEPYRGNIRFRLLGGPTPATAVSVTSTDPNSPMFSQLGFANNQGGTQKLKVPTLQSLIRALQDLFPSLNLNLALNQLTKRFTWHLQYNYTPPTQTTAFAYNTQFNLGSLADASFTGTLSVNGTIGIDCTVGLDFSAATAPKLLGSFLVPPPSNGHLIGDSTFVINLNDGTRFPISVTAAETAGFTQLKDLVDLLNSKLLPYSFNPGTGLIPLNTAIIFLQARNPDNSLAPGISLAAVNEDLDADGVLDVAEDINLNGILDTGEDIDGDRRLDVNEDKVYLLDQPAFVNGVLNTMLNKVKSLTIEAAPNDPIFNEIGFQPSAVARGSIKGIFADNVVLTGSATVSATNLAASARLALFGLATSGGTAVGAANFVINLVNPLGGSRIPVSQLLGDLRHLGDYIGINPTWSASLDIHLGNLVVTPNIFAGLIPAGAEVRLFVPDLRYTTYNPNPYHPVTNKQGLFVTYPQFGPLLNFNCLSAADLIVSLRSLSSQLTQFKGFDFLNKPLPLINISISQVIDFAANLAQTIQGLATGNSKTLDLLEASMESLLGIPANNLTFSVDHAAVQTLVTGSAGVSAEYRFNPSGLKNALHFTSVAATGNNYNAVLFNFIDDGMLAPGTNVAVIDNYDAPNKTVTIHYNATYTTAATIRAALHAKFLANNVTMPFDATLDPVDAGNDGSGTVQQTALKMELSYHVAYSNSLPFAFGLGDLVNLLPLNSPVRPLLMGVADLITVAGSGNLNVTAAADLKLVLGLDVSNPCGWKPFFFDSDYNGPGTGTNISLTASVRATNLNFTAGLGAINISIQNGTATLDSDGLPNSAGGDQDASFVVTLNDSNGDGRHYLRNTETFFNTNNIGITLTAGASAVLPLYLLGGSIPVGTNADANGDGYPDNDLVVIIPSFKRLFLPEKTNLSNQAILTSPGANNDLLFTGPGPGREVRIINVSGTPSASLNGTRLELNINSLISPATQVTSGPLAAQITSLGWSAALSATDPGNNGTGAVYADLTILAPNVASLFTGFNPCDLITNAPMLLNGLDGLLATIQNGLANNVLNKALPLVGNKLSQAADFIDKFRNGLLADIRAQLLQSGDPIALVKKAIFKSLGKDGLDLIVKSDDSPINTPEDIEIECTGSAIEFKIHLKKSLAVVDTSAHPINFDIGVPALGLSVNGNVKVQIGFDLKLYFGISASDGFYFDTSSDEELRVDFKVTIPGMHAKGSLLFLQLDVNDDAADPSSFTGYFTVDVSGPSSHPGRLKFSDFSNPNFTVGDAFSAQLGAMADVNLQLAVSFQGNAVFPRLLAEFNLDWEWTLGDPDGKLSMGFHDIQLDAGAFISGFVQPILAKVQMVTEPLQPLMDLLTTPIPIISDLAGKPIDMLALASRFGLIKPGTEEFIRDLADIITLINDTSFTDNGSILIKLGDIELQADGVGNVERKADDPDPDPQPLSNGTSDSGTKNFLKKIEDLGFKFPFLKISEIFKLFSGQPVTIVEYHMPVLDFTFRFEDDIPIYPPLYAFFGGQAGAKIDLTFGYDTYGLQKFFSTSDKHVADIFDGFFIKDVDDSGNDVDEVVLTGGLFAGAKLSLGFAEVGVSGGLFAEMDFNLNDPDDDGKVRLSEIIANAKHDIRCIFDIHGEVYVELTAFFKLLSFEKDWDFGHITLLTFELTCPTPVLADLSSGVLTLNMGPRAADRIEGDIEDGDEHFIVRHIEGPGTNALGETVEVSFDGIKQVYKGVKRIIADGGEGNDTIDLRGVLVPATVTGGNGNDTLYAGNVGRLPGVGQLFGSLYSGDAGNDRITGALAKDIGGNLVDDEFHGGDGNDTLTGNEGDDWLYGDAGNDSITGNAGNDLLYGADGSDVINGNDGNDTIDAGAGNDRITAGLGNDIILAGAGADTVDAGAGNDSVDGGPGPDVILAGDGNDWVDAGPGNDRITGGRGDDQIIGGDNNDYIDGGAGSDILVGDLATIAALPFSATVFPVSLTNISGDGNDVIIGGAGVDVIFGVGGDDRIFGGSLLTNGQNQVSGSNPAEFYDGADFIDAGADNDIVFADDAHGSPSSLFPGASIHGSAWFDIADVYAVVNNIRDPGENGLANVSVELHRINTSLVGTTVTDALGKFTFSGLDPGDYYLVFALPTGLTYATQNVGPDDTIDSDVDGTGKTGTIHVDAGASDTTHAAGYHGTNPQISINDQSIIEGSSGLSELLFTVTLSNPSSQLVTVCYDSSSGFGPRGADRILDFSSVSGTLTFLPGETTTTISVPIVGDNVYEGDYETFTVMLSTPHNSAIDPMHTVGTGSIIDDDTAPVVSVIDTRKTEGTALAFVVQLSNASKYPVSVQYRTSQTVNLDGTLVFDGAITTLDYVSTYELTPGSIVFSPGQTAMTVLIGTFQDNLDEYDERMNLTITLDPAMPGNYATAGRTVGLGFILDDDATPYVQITPITQTVLEGHAGTTPVFLSISLHDPITNLPTVSGRPVTVSYNTAPGTASVLPGLDGDAEYVFGRVVFAPQTNSYAGDSALSISVNIIGDTRYEPQVNGLWEYFFVNLLSATNGVLDARDDNLNRATIFAQDDEVPDPGPWYVQFDRTNYSVKEGQALTFTIVAAENSSFPMGVYWTIGGAGVGVATPVADYSPVWENGTNGPRRPFRFAPGQTAMTFTIPTVQDNFYEGDEVFNLYLANPTGGPVRAPNQVATVTIVEDDPVPHIKINDVSGSESSGLLHFTVTATGTSVVPFTVNWLAYNGTAKAPGDFSPAGGSFVIPAFTGSYIEDLTSDPANHPKVTIVNDLTPELTENLYVRLTLATPNSAIIDDYEGKGTLLDNDPIIVHGFVFMDLNGNGFYNSASDYGLTGVQVTITDPNGNHTITTGPTLVDANGPYNYALNVLLGSDTINVNPLTTPANSIDSTGSLPFSFLFSIAVVNAPDIGFTVPTDDEFDAPSGSPGESGGAYNDTVYGGQGNDTIYGGAGDDWLIGGHWLGPLGACDGLPYNAVVRDLNGRRFVDPTLPPPNLLPASPMFSPANNQEEPPCPDDDIIHGSDGLDLILGDYGYFNSLGQPVQLGIGDTANDKLFGEAGNDRIYGQGGNDQIPGGLGDDYLDGGPGDDYFTFNGDQNDGNDTIIEAPFGGNDTIDLSQTAGWSITFDLSSVAQQTVTPSLKITLPVGSVIENVIGGYQDDVLTGNALDNKIEGRNGNDTLIGGAGTNWLIGGLGSDRYLVDADGLAGLDIFDEVASLATANDVDVIDFAGTTGVGVALNLSIAVLQPVTANLNAVITDPLGFENLYGGDAADTLIGNARPNTIWPRAGNDTLNGGAGIDTLREERGSGFNLTNSTLTVTVTGEVDNYSNFENVSLVGDNAPNILNATTFTGTVSLDGRGGNDTLRGGTGTNYLTGGAGDDIIFASTGLDIITESRDADFTLGNSSLFLALFAGGNETDTYNLTNGTIEQANLTGGDHNNQLNATAFSGTVTLRGGLGNDTLIGTANADVLIGEAGNDSLQGGAGNDTYLFDADLTLGSDTLVEVPAGGIDTLDFSLTDSSGLTINLGDSSVLPFTGTQVVNPNLTLTFPANVLENVSGGQRDDVIIGNSLQNLLLGNDGNDTLTGGLGNDIIDGGAGINPATAQPYVDRLVETRDDDMTLTNVSMTFAGGDTDSLVSIETATLTGGAGNNILNAGSFLGSVILYGAAGNDLLVGGYAADFLTGGAGDDLLAGFNGDDTYLFDTDSSLGSDTVFESPGIGTGIDTFDFAATTTLSVTVDLSLITPQIVNANLTLTLLAGNVIERAKGGALNDTLTGNVLANLLVGNDGNDTLTGKDGNDTLFGGNGDDTYAFDADTSLGTDTILEDVGAGGIDTLDFSLTSTPINLNLASGGDVPQVVVSGNLQLLLLACTSIENAIGGSGGDFITGNVLDNRIEGGPGNDFLIGGGGNDTYLFDADAPLGTDMIIEFADVEGGSDSLDFSATTSLSVLINLSNPSTQFVNVNLSLLLNNIPYFPVFSPYAFENVIGGSLPDTILGNDLDNLLVGGPGDDLIFAGAGSDTLQGDAGDDTLYGEAGNDRIIGGADNDLMFGGTGNDTYLFDADVPLTSGIGNDLIVELPTEGGDTLDFSATTTLAISIDLGTTSNQAVNANLTLALFANNTVENAIGGALNDTLKGNSVDNRLAGGAGNDTFVIDADSPLGVDTFVEVASTAGGVDLLDFSATTTLQVTANLSLTDQQAANANLRFILSSGAAFENVTGGALNNVLTGNTLNNQISSGPGNDVLIGGEGDDTFILLQYGNPHNVTITGGGGEDTLNFSAFTAALTVNLATVGSTQTVAVGELRGIL